MGSETVTPLRQVESKPLSVDRAHLVTRIDALRREQAKAAVEAERAARVSSDMKLRVASHQGAIEELQRLLEQAEAPESQSPNTGG